MKITRPLYCAMPFFQQLFAHAQMIRIKGSKTWEERPRTRMSDPTIATENELDREDSNRERAQLKRARDGSNERTDQYVCNSSFVSTFQLIAR